MFAHILLRRFQLQPGAPRRDGQRGTTGVLTGQVQLAGDSAIEFASAQITSVDGKLDRAGFLLCDRFTVLSARYCCARRGAIFNCPPGRLRHQRPLMSRLSGKTSRLRPRHVVPKPTQAYEPEVPVEVREWIAPAPPQSGAEKQNIGRQ
jgi:hypothetical protein